MTHEGQHHVSNLVSDLVEMAQATKRLPELERELAEARKIIERDGATIARLELKLQDRAVELDDLRAKLRSVEAERDDAGFRQLEAEDKAGALHRAIESIFPALGQSLAAVNGDGKDQVRRVNKEEQAAFEMWQDEQAYKRAEAQRAAEEAAKPVDPTPVPLASTTTGTESVASATEGQSATDPTGASSGDMPLPSGGFAALLSTSSASGVSVSSDPTALQPTSPSETAPDTTATPQDGAPTPASPKYANKAYRSWPVYVSEADWCRGGGTTESYWEGREQYRNIQAGVA